MQRGSDRQLQVMWSLGHACGGGVRGEVVLYSRRRQRVETSADDRGSQAKSERGGSIASV